MLLEPFLPSKLVAVTILSYRFMCSLSNSHFYNPALLELVRRAGLWSPWPSVRPKGNVSFPTWGTAPGSQGAHEQRDMEEELRAKPNGRRPHNLGHLQAVLPKANRIPIHPTETYYMLLYTFVKPPWKHTTNVFWNHSFTRQRASTWIQSPFSWVNEQHRFKAI